MNWITSAWFHHGWFISRLLNQQIILFIPFISESSTESKQFLNSFVTRKSKSAEAIEFTRQYTGETGQMSTYIWRIWPQLYINSDYVGDSLVNLI